MYILHGLPFSKIGNGQSIICPERGIKLPNMWKFVFEIKISYGILCAWDTEMLQWQRNEFVIVTNPKFVLSCLKCSKFRGAFVQSVMLINHSCDVILYAKFWLYSFSGVLVLQNFLNLILFCKIGTMLQAGRSRVRDPMRWLNWFNLTKPSSRTRLRGFLSF
jgi:hypothetical protein